MKFSDFYHALPQALNKLHPAALTGQPIIMVTWVASALSTVLAIFHSSLFSWLVVIFLWLTVLFANLAEAVAESRGKAQANSLRSTKTDAPAFKQEGTQLIEIPATQLEIGDIIVVKAGQIIPGDGDVIEGLASVDESAITGESAPVLRESGGDRCAVTGGTRVLSDQITVKITTEPGKSFIDRMINLVEGADRQKTPNEVALNILLTSVTIIFILVVTSLQPLAIYSGKKLSVLVLSALLVCIIPTTIGALLSAIGIAGMDRLITRNVIAKSGKAVEAAGDISTILLDKTGTITYGNRQAIEFFPLPHISSEVLASASWCASATDETPEGRSIVALAQNRTTSEPNYQGEFIAFSAQTRMSGLIRTDGSSIYKGAASAIISWVQSRGGVAESEVQEIVDTISSDGGTPLVVAEHKNNAKPSILGVIHLKDIVKKGMKERFETLRGMGITTIMITGDNQLTAQVIAQEAGVDDFLADATPEDKLDLIRKQQAGGRLVAMTGDGTNDAPALAQADVGVAMNTGTSAAKEAGNMIELDSDPTKLIEIIEIGKQLLITRGALFTFSIANDIAKYFTIIPALFVGIYPELHKLNIMGLHSAQSAILSAVIFNATIILALIPLAIIGVKYKPGNASKILGRNLTIYGLGGVIVPFIGIKIIDTIVALLPGI